MSGCYIDTGDDVIALKSGMDYCGREFNRPTKNILIKDSTLVNENLAIGRDILSYISKLHSITKVLTSYEKYFFFLLCLTFARANIIFGKTLITNLTLYIYAKSIIFIKIQEDIS